MTDATPIRVLLVDDHALFRKALAILFREAPDFEVVGEAADGLEAIAQAAALRPDVILMDMRMPRADGPEATRRIVATSPHVKIVMLTVSGDEDGVVDAVQSGAQGYLLKTIDPPALFDALRGVVRGEAALARGVATTIMQAFTRAGLRSAATAPPGSEFSLRAQQIIALVAEGKRNKEIATQLGLAENTVKNHLKTILTTLHLDNRVQVAAFALRTQGAPPAHGPVPQGPVDTAAPYAPRG
jgi:DNA-binding NarL/FixJ family response regulator